MSFVIETTEHLSDELSSMWNLSASEATAMLELWVVKMNCLLVFSPLTQSFGMLVELNGSIAFRFGFPFVPRRASAGRTD